MQAKEKAKGWTTTLALAAIATAANAAHFEIPAGYARHTLYMWGDQQRLEEDSIQWLVNYDNLSNRWTEQVVGDMTPVQALQLMFTANCVEIEPINPINPTRRTPTYTIRMDSDLKCQLRWDGERNVCIPTEAGADPAWPSCPNDNVPEPAPTPTPQPYDPETYQWQNLQTKNESDSPPDPRSPPNAPNVPTESCNCGSPGGKRKTAQSQSGDFMGVLTGRPVEV